MTADRTAAMVETHGLSRDFRLGSSVVHAVREVDLRVERGELVAIRGPLRLRQDHAAVADRRPGPADAPVGWSSTARVGRDMTADELVELRRRHKIGFVFQAFGLLPILSAAENVEVPMRLVRRRAARARRAGRGAARSWSGWATVAGQRPHELSGGEQQRVAIARALANRPDLLLADEPTGQLDSETGRAIMALLRAIVRSEGLTAIVATHDPMLIDLADRAVELRDGRIVDGAVSRTA